MADQSNGKTNAERASTTTSEESGERSRVESSRSTLSDPAVVGLGRVLAGLCALLVVGLVIMMGGFMSGDVDWDSPVMRRDQEARSLGQAQQATVRPIRMETTTQVIRFDLDRLNREGLTGPADGLRALSYEFCIPADEQLVEVVRSIDSTVEIQRRSPGRIGCGEGEYLAVGHTHQSDFESVLVRLSRLPFVDRIEEAYFE